MKTCSRCGCNTVDKVKFCPDCGNEFSPANPTQTPPSPYDTHAASTEYGSPAPQKPPALAKSIVSMVLSISALECAAVGLFFVVYLAAILLPVMGFAIGEMPMDGEIVFLKGFLSIYFAIIASLLGGIGLAMSLVGRYLGRSAKAQGNRSKMAHFGIKLGNIALVLSIVALALAALVITVLWIL